MPQETLGYVEMEWTCRRCGTKNPGLTKTCANCGAQMEAEQQFEKPAGQTLIADAAKLEQTGKGADVHCPFCGTRNPAGAATCSQCGGDLTKAQKREAGQVVGAFKPGEAAAPVICPACHTANAASAAQCASCGRPLGSAAAPATPPTAAPPTAAPPTAASSPRAGQPNLIVMAGLGLIALACLLGVGFLVFQSFNTSAVPGVVQAVEWERSISVEAQVTVSRENWRDRVPAGAQINTCQERPRELRAGPDASRRSEKICGTPYTVDQGDGTGKVVQDCEYQIYDDYCSYAALEWREVDRAVANGQDLNPFWPDIALGPDQREGDRAERYAVTLAADDRDFTYTPEDEAEFLQFELGSRWTLQVNGLGGLNGVAPAR